MVVAVGGVDSELVARCSSRVAIERCRCWVVAQRPELARIGSPAAGVGVAVAAVAAAAVVGIWRCRRPRCVDEWYRNRRSPNALLRNRHSLSTVWLLAVAAGGDVGAGGAIWVRVGALVARKEEGESAGVC